MIVKYLTPAAFLIATIAGTVLAGPRAERLNMSISSSLFQGKPEALVKAVLQPFEALLQAQTGMGGELVSAGNGDAVARNLMDDKIQVGVVEGIEYAWLKAKYPQIRPLMILMSNELYPRACLVVHKGDSCAQVADLQGKVLAELKDGRHHCRLFRERLCRQAAPTAKQFFARIVETPTAEAALDDVVDDQVQGAIVDKACFDRYKHRKPARAEQLKIMQVSEEFPTCVVIYRDGALAPATLQRFHQGMLNANQTALGRQLMMLWKVTAFAPVPEDYEEHVAQIIKAYPPPQ